MRFRARLVATVAAVAAAAVCWFPAAAEAAHSSTLLRAGYFATTNPQHTIAVTVVAPDLRCTRSGRRAVAVGAFGTLSDTYGHKTTTHTWAAIVRTVCTDGTKVSKAIFKNHVNASTSMRVRPGDRVKLSISGAQYWSIKDGSSQQAGAGPIQPREEITANPRVLFGAQFSAPRLPRTPVHVLHARSGHHSLSGLHPIARLARHGNHVIARPTGIHAKTGAFDVKHT
jgi:hypothetical protein